MKGKILPTFVLAKKIKEKDHTESGLVIPVEVMNSPTVVAEVVLTGESAPEEKMTINLGDKILFSNRAFRQFVNPLDKQEYLLVAQKDVMFIF